MSARAPALQAYFTQRLVAQRAASPNTIAAYRTTFCLLLRFAAQRTGKAPSKLDIGELDPPLIAAFVEYLEHDRHNRPATRNNRFAAIHSLLGYLALQHPEHAASVQRVLAVPPKRTDRNLVTYLTEPEVDALLDACDKTTWTGRRDHAVLALTIQTGLRISELAGLPARTSPSPLPPTCVPPAKAARSGERVRLVNPVWLRCLGILVDQSAEDRSSFDSGVGRVDGFRWRSDGRPLIKRSMWTMSVEMTGVLVENGGQVMLTDDEHSVGALAANAADPALGHRVRPRCPRRRLDHLDALGGEYGVEGGGELGITVAQQEPQARHPLVQLQ